MKVICKKDNEISKMLELVKKVLETENMDYPLLKEDLILEIQLKNEAGQECPDQERMICLEEKDYRHWEENENVLEYYYNKDALTKLYNRSKYERDIQKLQTDKEKEFACIYIDAVGLHETNNHLGHAAGDKMLCAIADGIREYFPESLAYRIGGDEFVIFCFHYREADRRQRIQKLKELLKREGYEISVGMRQKEEKLSFVETINQAELAMREDKTMFYRQNGAERQLRGLNHKLEKILLEKQDASQFLNVIASEYKGVYMVDPDKDICRNIFIPEYFKALLKEYDGVFSKAIAAYCDRLVCEHDQEEFRRFFDFEEVLKQIRQGKQMAYTYTKKDGSSIRMQITIYDPNSLEKNEMLWIFMDDNKKNTL